MRDEFDRDLDRIVFSTPFRRLQDKTQVFPLEPNDSVRTRLTHSLEVSRAARGMAKDVCRWLRDAHIDGDQAKCIETIAAACGLVHDLGNPPFGHSGETAIRNWFDRQDNNVTLPDEYAADFRKFEGNAQTIRLLTKLQILADFHGLNLTYGTLSAACKYLAPSTGIDEKIHEFSKTGFFVSEKDVIERIRAEVGTEACRNPITFLVEAADDAVYNAIDIEDGFKKRLLDWQLIKNELLKEAPNDPLLKESIDWAEGRVEGAKLTGRAKEGALVEYFRVRAIGNVIVPAAQAFKDHYGVIMNGEYHGELVMDSRAADLVRACRKLNRSYVYTSEETLKLELMGRTIIWDLMDLFWEGVQESSERRMPPFAAKAFGLLSDNYRRAFEHSKEEGCLPLQYYQLQLVSDYICGMTDTYAADLHRRLMNG